MPVYFCPLPLVPMCYCHRHRVSKVDSFDPETVPTVLKLVEEIDAFSKAEAESEVRPDFAHSCSHFSLFQVKKNVKAYKMTSMKEPVNIFEEFLSGLSSEWKGKLIEKSDQKMDF